MLKLDIGCGATGRPDFVGIDYTGNPDVLCDVAKERLPFDDGSAEHIYSAHCFEHIAKDSLLHVFREMTRVCRDGGLIEIWHPHVFHADAFVFGHINYLSEAIYNHLACEHREFWRKFLGAQWIMQEVRYVVEPSVLRDIKTAGMSIEFSISYLHDVIKEIGLFIQVDRSASLGPTNYRRVACATNRQEIILELHDGPHGEPLPPAR